jgi:hypothetical protein
MTATPAAQELRPDAVVWVDERHAIVARTDAKGSISTVEIRRVGRPETRYLAQVAHELRDRERVMVVGPAVIKLAFEREYVAISHRPDRLMAPPAGCRETGAEILDRMERLAA